MIPTTHNNSFCSIQVLRTLPRLKALLLLSFVYIAFENKSGQATSAEATPRKASCKAAKSASLHVSCSGVVLESHRFFSPKGGTFMRSIPLGIARQDLSEVSISRNGSTLLTSYKIEKSPLALKISIPLDMSDGPARYDIKYMISGSSTTHLDYCFHGQISQRRVNIIRWNSDVLNISMTKFSINAETLGNSSLLSFIGSGAAVHNVGSVVQIMRLDPFSGKEDNYWEMSINHNPKQTKNVIKTWGLRWKIAILVILIIAYAVSLPNLQTLPNTIHSQCNRPQVTSNDIFRPCSF